MRNWRQRHLEGGAPSPPFLGYRNTGPAEFARAALESVAFQTRDLLDAMRRDWKRRTSDTVLRVDGGMVASDWTMQRLADILDAPGGLLLIADENGSIEPAASWNWSGSANPGASIPGSEALAFWLSVGAEGRIIDFDAHAGGWADARDLELDIPQPLLGEEQAWTGVPLIHDERLVGLVLLAAPDYRRPLDWEDFDLLRTAGRQAASSLAEAHSQQALMNAQRFEDFNRRFAFIMHDVKNLVSQLSLLSRNGRAAQSIVTWSAHDAKPPENTLARDFEEALWAVAGARRNGRTSA